MFFSFCFFPIYSLRKNPSCQLPQFWKSQLYFTVFYLISLFQMLYQCDFLSILRKGHRNCKPMVASSAFNLNNTLLWFLIVEWQFSYYPMFLKMPCCFFLLRIQMQYSYMSVFMLLALFCYNYFSLILNSFFSIINQVKTYNSKTINNLYEKVKVLVSLNRGMKKLTWSF